jgi:hypothetical protein
VPGTVFGSIIAGSLADAELLVQTNVPSVAKTATARIHWEGCFIRQV